jgi:hypothetical protein
VTQLVKADKGDGRSAFQKDYGSSLQAAFRVQEIHRNREIAYTVPTQPKTGHLSHEKSAVSKNQLTRSG